MVFGISFPKFTNKFLIFSFDHNDLTKFFFNFQYFVSFIDLIWYLSALIMLFLLETSLVNIVHQWNWSGLIYQLYNHNFVINSIICGRFPQNCSILKLHNLLRIVAIVRTTNWTWSLLHEDPLYYITYNRVNHEIRAVDRWSQANFQGRFYWWAILTSDVSGRRSNIKEDKYQITRMKQTKD